VLMHTFISVWIHLKIETVLGVHSHGNVLLQLNECIHACA